MPVEEDYPRSAWDSEAAEAAEDDPQFDLWSAAPLPQPKTQ
jgi:hypothetical protein